MELSIDAGPAAMQMSVSPWDIYQSAGERK
jgi:hypothetical protein